MSYARVPELDESVPLSTQHEISGRTLSGNEADAPPLAPSPAAHHRGGGSGGGGASGGGGRGGGGGNSSKAAAAAVAALVAPLPPGLSAPSYQQEALNRSQDADFQRRDTVSFHPSTGSVGSGGGQPQMAVPTQAVIAAQKFARRGRSASTAHREKEVQHIRAALSKAAEKDGDVPAPEWFEHEIFRRATNDYWKVRAIYVLLSLAPFLTSGGSFLELFFGCPTHSPTVELFFAVGMFSFATVPLMLYKNLRLLVRGAWKNKSRLQEGIKNNDRRIEKFLAAAEPATVQLQSAYRGKLAREKLRKSGRSKSMVARTLSHDSAGTSTSNSLGKKRALIRTMSQDMADPTMSAHLAKAVATAATAQPTSLPLSPSSDPLSDMPNMDSATLAQVLGSSGFTDSADLVQKRLKAAAWVVHGVMGMKKGALEAAIDDLEYDAQERVRKTGFCFTCP
jgi:hypothetical protein